MKCPHLERFEKDMCISSEVAIIPSQKHVENFCNTDSHWACPMKRKFLEIADTFAYSL